MCVYVCEYTSSIDEQHQFLTECSRIRVCVYMYVCECMCVSVYVCECTCVCVHACVGRIETSNEHYYYVR